MIAYIIRRLLLIIPTLFGIMVLNFAIVQVAPGGPVEQTLARIKGTANEATNAITGNQSELIKSQQTRDFANSSVNTRYRGAAGLDPELVKRIEKMYGFDKPAIERFWLMIKDYATFNFGQSFFKGRPVVDLIFEKIPVSISLGLWSTLIVYLVSIPLGIAKAVRDGSPFDVWTSTVIVIGTAIPSYLFAILLIVVFAGGSYLSWFPLQGLTSSDADTLPWWQHALDYLWHLVLPTIALIVGSFAGLTMLTKNSFIDQINQQYVTTARAKGLTERRVLYGHVFRNAMLIVIAGFPGAFIGILFTGALLIEIIFNLDGVGLLGYEATLNRDYPIMFGTLYIYTLIGMLIQLINDITYMIVDPRIDFEARAA
ncbi:MAG TPA: microcin C ABC transporter permease YejB [Dongiaceae bacterium]|jgi:microcin C transport system permease protein|nr:microcin C ABC transporter permease YejB [Dongiaceae bacterium]